jgi:hypothetical protein
LLAVFDLLCRFVGDATVSLVLAVLFASIVDAVVPVAVVAVAPAVGVAFAFCNLGESELISFAKAKKR